MKSSNAKSSRTREIITILAKYGLADWLTRANVDWITKYLKNTQGKLLNEYTQNQRIRLALNELGTTFIKLGQVLSTRPDIIGFELAGELSLLQTSTFEESFEKIEETILNTLDIESLNEIFSEFEEKPTASASVAQVHKAKLLNGETVAVKIMRSDVEEKVTRDLKIMGRLVTIAQNYGGPLKAYQPLAMFKLFKKTLEDELDFRKEFRNLEIFNDNFSKDNNIHFPKPFLEYSGKDVLTMEFLNGTSIKDFQDLKLSDEEAHKFAMMGAHAFTDMIFRDNFYHADPHPGNLIYMEKGQLGILDCGMVGRLDAYTNEKIEEMIIGISQKDSELLKNAIIDLGSVPGDIDYNEFSFQIDNFLDTYLETSLHDFDMAAAARDFTGIIQTFHIILPGNVSILLRVLVMLEGTAQKIDPTFDIAEFLDDYKTKILLRKFSPKRFTLKLAKNIRLWENIIQQTPHVLSKILRQADRNNFEIKLKHHNLEKSVNKVVLALLTASLFLGSSWLWANQTPPLYKNISIIGMSGFLFAFLMGIKLVWDIFRSGKK